MLVHMVFQAVEKKKRINSKNGKSKRAYELWKVGNVRIMLDSETDQSKTLNWF